MKILITGGSGFIGKALAQRLVQDGHSLVVTTRSFSGLDGRFPYPCEKHQWDGGDAPFPMDAVKDVEVVFNLMGEPVVGGRWDMERKRRIAKSRVNGTRTLVAAIKSLAEDQRPKIVINSSAIGYYGDRGAEVLTEDSYGANDFLARICKQWESQLFMGLEDTAVRAVAIRTGIVLGPGGALGKMLPVAKAGLFSPLGSGQQWMSWIHLNDLVKLFISAMENPELSGPMNGVAPFAVTNREFTKTLNKSVRRWTLPAVPNFLVKSLFGEAASVLLASQRVRPEKPMASGFKFEFEKLDQALASLT